jgi:uncharacterized protein
LPKSDENTDQSMPVCSRGVDGGSILIADCMPFMVVGSTTMDSLHPALADILSQGLVISRDVAAEEIGLNETDERVAGSLSVNLELHRQDDAVTVAGTLEGTAVRQCVRCLTDYEDPLYITLYADYLRQVQATFKKGGTSRHMDRKTSPARPNRVGEEVDEEDEIYHYQGEQLDLIPMLREQVILAAPMQPLCKEDCAGLCPRCGQNLNDRRCACEPEPMDSPFRILRTPRGKDEKDSGV